MKYISRIVSFLRKMATSEVVRVVVFLSFLVVLFNWKVLFGDKVFYQNYADLADVSQVTEQAGYNPRVESVHTQVQYRFFPWNNYNWESMRQGRLPLWNPYLLGGMPHFATGETASLEPLKLLLYWLPFEYLDFWNLLVLFRFVLAGLFIYLFLKKWKLSGLASVFGSVAFMFCAFNVAWIGHQRVAVLLWLPFLLWCLESLVRQAKTRYFILLGFGFAAVFYSGIVDTTWQVLGFFWTYTLLRLVFTDEYTFASFRKDIFRKAILACLAGTLLAAVQLVPYLEYLSQTREAGTVVASGFFDLVADLPQIIRDTISNITDLTLLFSPGAAQSQISGTWIFPHTNYHDSGMYVGLMTIVFVCLGLFGNMKRKFSWFLLGMGGISLLLAMLGSNLPDSYSPSWFFAVVNSRLRWIFEFNLIVLAAFGFDYLMSHLDDKKFFPLLLVLLLFFELFRVHSGYIPLKSKDSESSGESTLAFISEHQLAGERIIAVDDVIYPNAALAFGLADVRGSNDRYLKNYLQATAGFLDRENDVLTTDVFAGDFWDALSVRYILTQNIKRLFGEEKIASPDQGETPISYTLLQTDPVALIENTDTLPKTFVSYNAMSYGTEYAMTKVIRDEDFSWRDDVLVLKREVFEEGNMPIDAEEATHGSIRSVELNRYEPEYIEVYVRSEQEGFLVLNDTYYPGWLARVDDVDVPIYLTNGIYRSVDIPAGNSLVTFEYKPLSLMAGEVASLLGGLLVLTIAVPRFWWHSKQAWINIRAYFFEKKRETERRNYFG